MGRILLAVVLILVILAAAGFLALQRYIVYDENGNPRLEFPNRGDGSGSASASTSVSSGDLNIIIDRKEPEETDETPAEPQPEPVSGGLWAADLPLTDWQTLRDRLDPEASAVCVTVKDENGYVRVDSTVTAALSRSSVSVKKTTQQAVSDMTAEENITAIARIVCLRDPRMSIVSVRGFGLRQTGGYLFYDDGGVSWLDPAKTTVREYLTGLARECADMGFDEILLAEAAYPTDGSLDKIGYGETPKTENLRVLIQEIRTALEESGVKLSLELPASVVLEGGNDDSGQVLAELAPLADAVYVRTTAEEAPALAEKVKEAGPDTAFVAVVTDAAGITTDYLLVEE